MPGFKILRLLQRITRGTAAKLTAVKPEGTSFAWPQPLIAQKPKSSRSRKSSSGSRSAKKSRKHLSREGDIAKGVAHKRMLQKWHCARGFITQKRSALKQRKAEKLIAIVVQKTTEFVRKQPQKPFDYEAREMQKLRCKAFDKFSSESLTWTERQKLFRFSSKVLRYHLGIVRKETVDQQINQTFVSYSAPVNSWPMNLFSSSYKQKRKGTFSNDFDCKRRLISKDCDLAAISEKYNTSLQQKMSAPINQNKVHQYLDDSEGEANQNGQHADAPTTEDEMEPETMQEDPPTMSPTLEGDLVVESKEKEQSQEPQLFTKASGNMDTTTTESTICQSHTSTLGASQTPMEDENNDSNGLSTASYQLQQNAISTASKAAFNAFSRNKFLNGYGKSTVSYQPRQNAGSSSTGFGLNQNALSDNTFFTGQTRMSVQFQQHAGSSATGSSINQHAFSGDIFSGSLNLFQSQYNTGRTPAPAGMSDEMDVPEAPSPPFSPKPVKAPSANSWPNGASTYQQSSSERGGSAYMTGTPLAMGDDDSFDDHPDVPDLPDYEDEQEDDAVDEMQPVAPKVTSYGSFKPFDAVPFQQFEADAPKTAQDGSSKLSSGIKQFVPVLFKPTGPPAPVTQRKTDGRFSDVTVRVEPEDEPELSDYEDDDVQEPADVEDAQPEQTAAEPQTESGSGLDSLEAQSWGDMLDDIKNGVETNGELIYAVEQADCLLDEVTGNMAAKVATRYKDEAGHQSFGEEIDKESDLGEEEIDGKKNRGLGDSDYASVGNSLSSTESDSSNGTNEDTSGLSMSLRNKCKGFPDTSFYSPGLTQDDRKNYPGLFEPGQSEDSSGSCGHQTEPEDIDFGALDVEDVDLEPDDQAPSKLLKMTSHHVVRVFDTWTEQFSFDTNYLIRYKRDIEAEKKPFVSEMHEGKYGSECIKGIVQYVTRIAEYAEASGKFRDLQNGGSWAVRSQGLDRVGEAVDLVALMNEFYAEEEECGYLSLKKEEIIKARQRLRDSVGK